MAVTIGLLVLNAIQPGDQFDETKAQLEASIKAMPQNIEATETVKERGPPKPLIDMVPDNFRLRQRNRNMLQIVFFSLLASIANCRCARNDGQFSRSSVDCKNW